MEHWKFGDGFAIRYGGNRDITWFFDAAFRQPGGVVGMPPIHPAFLALEAVKSVGLVLQWWEMRKHGLIVAAEFEERRVSWVSEMLSTWAADIANAGTIRRDSTCYLQRELERLMQALIKTPKMDIHSNLLLQVERTSLALVDVNELVYRELLRHYQDFGAAFQTFGNVPAYQPFNKIRGLVTRPEQPTGIFEALKRIVPKLFRSEADPFEEYLKYAKRRSDYVPVENLMLELRSSVLLLSFAAMLPATIHSYSKENILADTSGVTRLLEMPQLDGEGSGHEAPK